MILQPISDDFAAEAHRADADAIGFLHDLGFELGQLRHGIRVVESAEQLAFGKVVAVRAIAADADAERAGRAALALRLPDGVQNALANAFQVAIRAAQVFQLAGQGILDVLVLAAAALEDQLDLDLIFFPLIEVNDRRFGAEVVAAIFSGERIDRVGPQLAALGRFGDRAANRFA